MICSDCGDEVGAVAVVIRFRAALVSLRVPQYVVDDGQVREYLNAWAAERDHDLTAHVAVLLR